MGTYITVCTTFNINILLSFMKVWLHFILE